MVLSLCPSTSFPSFFFSDFVCYLNDSKTLHINLDSGPHHSQCDLSDDHVSSELKNETHDYMSKRKKNSSKWEPWAQRKKKLLFHYRHLPLYRWRNENSCGVPDLPQVGWPTENSRLARAITESTLITQSF